MKKVFIAGKVDIIEIVYAAILAIPIVLVFGAQWWAADIYNGALIAGGSYFAAALVISLLAHIQYKEKERLAIPVAANIILLAGPILCVFSWEFILPLFHGDWTAYFIYLVVLLVGNILTTVISLYGALPQIDLVMHPPSKAIQYRILLAASTKHTLGLIIFLTGIIGSVAALILGTNFWIAFVLFAVMAVSSLIAAVYGSKWHYIIALTVEGLWIAFWLVMVIFNTYYTPLLDLPLLLDPSAFVLTAGTAAAWAIGVGLIMLLRHKYGHFTEANQYIVLK